jgi:hypothetical protein
VPEDHQERHAESDQEHGQVGEEDVDQVLAREVAGREHAERGGEHADDQGNRCLAPAH